MTKVEKKKENEHWKEDEDVEDVGDEEMLVKKKIVMIKRMLWMMNSGMFCR